MGQVQSGEHTRHVTTEQVSHELALRFAKRCFTPIELYCFQNVFRSLADHQDSISYLKEETLVRFLELPDILGVSPIVFQMVSYLGAFPFAQDAPVVLGFEQLIMVVVIMSQRYERVLKQGSRDRTKLLFRSLAVYDRHLNPSEPTSGLNKAKDDIRNTVQMQNTMKHTQTSGFAIDEPIDDDAEEDDEELALAALDVLDAIDVFKHGDAPIAQASIPSDNLRKLIMLLLLIAPLDPQESLSTYSEWLIGERLESLRRTAQNVLAAFVNDVEKLPGAKFHQFHTVIPVSLPFLFNGFNPLFEHFLFSKNIDFTTRKNPSSSQAPIPQPVETSPPLLKEEGEILELNVLSQLSFFLPGSSLFRRLRLLYSGGDAGFSMGSFETKVFNWQAPTILLVAGNRFSDPPRSGQLKAFAETLPPQRFPNSGKSSRVVFGVYMTQHWRQTHKDCIGDTDTLLFQLEPVHEVFHASTINHDYISFTRPPSSHAGIGIGCPHPKSKPTAGLPTNVTLGSVSLLLDSSFEFGVFTHNYTSGGGAFHNSISRRYDWQDRFEIESVEVWGLGGDEEAESQKQRWAWEEREAEARRRVNLGTGDIEADRALLEMAGIIGGDRSGGSMR